MSCETFGFWWGNLNESAHLEDVSIVIKFILNKYNGTVCTTCLPQNNTDV